MQRDIESLLLLYSLLNIAEVLTEICYFLGTATYVLAAATAGKHGIDLQQFYQALQCLMKELKERKENLGCLRTHIEHMLQQSGLL